jgi:hypothetical protein
MNWTVRKTTGQIAISLVVFTVSVGTPDALAGPAGRVGIADHDGTAPRESGDGQASGDENPDQYRDSEVDDDEESDAKRGEKPIDIGVWNILNRFKQG